MAGPQTLVPEIRFRGFSDEWDYHRVSDFASILGGNSWQSKDYTDDGDYLVITIANVSGATYIDDTSGNRISCDSKNPYILRKNDILISLTGNVGRVSKMTDVPAVLNQRVAKIFTMSKTISEDLLFHVLHSKRFENAMIEAGQGAAQKNIRNKDISSYNITIPANTREQQLLATLFEDIERITDCYFQKYNQLKVIKKSMLEKMFPRDGSNVPEIRFAGFTNPWEQRKLDEFVTFFSGLTYSPKDIRPSGTLVLRSSNVKDGEVVDADNVYVDPSVVNSENVQDGDIIVVVRNGSRALIGKHAEIKGFKPNTVIGAFMTGIRSEHSSFVNALLNTPRFDSEVAMNMGATINQITGYMFSKMEFLIPDPKEQDAIGDYFRQLDTLITLHQRKYEMLQKIKNSLLQKMLV